MSNESDVVNVWNSQSILGHSVHVWSSRSRKDFFFGQQAMGHTMNQGLKV